MPQSRFSAAVLLAASTLFSFPVLAQQGGFVEQGATQTSVITVMDAKNLRDDTRVVLRGNIVRSLGDEKYAFRDASGEITVEIDDDIWHGQMVSPKDPVEIRGEIDRDFRLSGDSIEIEVDQIRKL